MLYFISFKIMWNEKRSKKKKLEYIKSHIYWKKNVENNGKNDNGPNEINGNRKNGNFFCESGKYSRENDKKVRFGVQATIRKEAKYILAVAESPLLSQLPRLLYSQEKGWREAKKKKKKATKMAKDIQFRRIADTKWVLCQQIRLDYFFLRLSHCLSPFCSGSITFCCHIVNIILE